MDNFSHVRVLDWERQVSAISGRTSCPLRNTDGSREALRLSTCQCLALRGILQGYGTSDVEALCARPAYRYLEAQWLHTAPGRRVATWTQGAVHSRIPSPIFT